MRKIIVCLTLMLSMLIGFTKPFQANQSQVAILVYHHILPAADMETFSDNGLVLSLESFREQMEYLYRNDFHTITSSELRAFLYEKRPLPPRSVMITFDDGYMGNYLFAYPVLQQFGFNAIVFPITSHVQTQDQEYRPDRLDYLSWMQVAASLDVFEFGSHTHDLHTPVGGKTGFVTASIDDVRADLFRSLNRVHNRRLFAYPLGQHNMQLVDMLRFNGVDLAFTINRCYVNQDSDPLLLNRFTIYADTTLRTFERIVTLRYWS